MIKVSVIIPVYNDEEFLRLCLESVVHQTLEDIEIICVNDGSTDATGDILKEYQESFGNIIVYTQQNLGASHARNKAMQLARGEYIAFMDADDYYPEMDILECLYNTAKREGVKICGGTYMQDRGGILQKSPERSLYFEREGKLSFREYAYIYGFTRFIYLRDFIWKENIQFPLIRILEDPLFHTVAMVKGQEFYAIKKVVYCHRKGIHERIYNKQDAINALWAMHEILMIAKMNHMEKLQFNCICSFAKVFGQYIMPYYRSDDKEFLKRLEDVYGCIMQEVKIQLPDEVRYFTIRGIEDAISEAEKEFVSFDNTVRGYEKVIIYGAGVGGKSVLKTLETFCDRKPIGVGVTRLGQQVQFLGNLKVTNIRDWKDYCDNALFILAVGENLQQEMLCVLEEMEVKNIYVPAYRKLACYFNLKMLGENRAYE